MTREQFITQVKAEQNALRGFLLALCCGHHDEADDILQDALVKAYLALGQYADRGQFHAWIFKIAYNTFLTHSAGARQHSSIEEAQAVVGPAAADAAFEHQELYLALSTLPPRERTAVTLHYLEGCSVKEISKITGSSADAVKQQLSRGRAKLRENIGK